ncbi:MAG: hypothetical protein ACRDNS_11620, partial [Trebonia sp.]
MPDAEPTCDAYRAVALQTACDAVNAAPDAAACRDLMRAGIDRIHRQVKATKAFLGPDLKLVVLPEYVLTGHPMGEPLAEWTQRAALRQDGPE